MDLDEQLAELSRHVDKLKGQLARESGQVEALKRQRDNVIRTCEERGILPEKLDETIAQKRVELLNILSSAEELLLQIEEKRGAVLASGRVGSSAE